jgi:hypothetical protein
MIKHNKKVNTKKKLPRPCSVISHLHLMRNEVEFEEE